MLVLGIDPGTRSGWALIRDGQRIASGTWRLKFETGERPGQLFNRFRSCLADVYAYLFDEPDVIGYELRPGQGIKGKGGGQAAHIHGGIVAHIEQWAESHATPYTSVHPSTLKLWATGHGHAKKPDMVAEAKRRTGHAPEDDNEADAILVGLHTWEALRDEDF